MTPPDDTLKRLEEIEAIFQPGDTPGTNKIITWLLSTLREQLAVNQMLTEALAIKEEFLVCYRVGKQPTEKLWKRLEKNNSDLAGIEGGE